MASPQPKPKPRPKAKRKPPQSSPKPQIVLTMDFGEELSWQEKLKRWLVGLVATGYGVSLLVHLLLIVALSFYIMESAATDEQPLSTRFSENPNDEPGFDDIVDVQLDMATEAESLTIPQMLVQQPSSLEPVLSALATGGKGQSGDAVGFRMPSGGKAVTKGSFTAWTVPADPKPGQYYLIVIQVKLPEKIKKYRQEDLTGFLTGDDGFTTPLGAHRGSKKHPKKYYGQFDMKAKQFVIRIPGAAAKVKDTIRIESKRLREKQELIIVF